MSARNRVADEDILTEMVDEKLESWSDRISALLGPAPGTEHVSGQVERDLWDEQDEAVDVIAEYWRARGEGMDEEDAMDAASLKKYKNRGVMLLNAAPDDEGRAKYAARMRRQSETQAGVTEEPYDAGI